MLDARICKIIKKGETDHKNELDVIQFKNLINKQYYQYKTSERFDLIESSSSRIKN